MSETNRTLLITGASGVLGRELLRVVSRKNNWQLAVLTSDKAAWTTLSLPQAAAVYDFNDLAAGSLPISAQTLIVHAGFARSQDGGELVRSIDTASRLFAFAAERQAAGIINISSQGVYSPLRERPAKESDIPAPADKYGVAKYACESLGQLVAAATATRFTSLRLASLIGPGFPERIVTKFIQRILADQPLKLVGGNQIFSFLDSRDAAAGIATFINSGLPAWEPVYHLGTPESYSLTELANRTIAVVKDLTGHHSELETEPGDIQFNSTLNCDRFTGATGWRPAFRLEDSIKHIIENL